MNGLERIIEKIEADAESVSASAVTDAEVRAQDIITEATERGDALADEIIKEAEDVAAAMIRKAHSGGDLQKKKMILERKVDIITGVVAKAVRNFLGGDAGEYFDAMVRLCEKYALAEETTMIFSDKDFQRMPADFEKRVNAAGKGKITIRGGGSFIGGFLLVGEEITQNCTIEALIGDAETEIRDELYKLLFTE